MNLLRSIVFILVFVIPASANANNNAQPKDKSSVSAPTLQQQLVLLEEETRLLREQNQLIKSYQDNLLSTVYWSLGVLATIAVGLVGFGWFANFKIYERDKLALSQELKAVSNVEIEMQTKMIPGLVEESAKSKFSALQVEINVLKSTLENRLGSAEIAILEAEHRNSVTEEVYANAINEAANLLRKALALKTSWRVANYLELIRQDLVGLMGKGQAMFSSDISTLVKLLDETNSEHGITVNLIKELLAKVRRHNL